jgi:hypothetical protein
MNAADLILAAALLSAPAGTPEPIPDADHWPRMRAAVIQVATARQVIDPREARYTLTGPGQWQGDLDILRARNADLIDAPRVEDADWLPPTDIINELIRFNRAHRAYLKDRQLWESDRATLYADVINETDRLYRVWDAAREAKGEWCYVTFRRQALRNLRDRIGPEMWGRNELPPAVPEWRFRPGR